MCQRTAKDRAAIDFIQSDTCETFNSALKMVENFYRSLGDNKKPKIIYYPMHKGGNHWMLYNLHRAHNNQGGFCGFFCLNSMGPNLYGLEISQKHEGLQMFINIFLNYSKRFGSTGSKLTGEQMIYNVYPTYHMNHLCFSTPILFRQSNQYDCGFAVILFVLEFSRAFNDVKFHEKMFVHCIDGNVFQNVHVENIWALDVKYYNSFGKTWIDPDTKISCDTVMQGMRWDCLHFIDNMTIRYANIHGDPESG